MVLSLALLVGNSSGHESMTESKLSPIHSSEFTETCILYTCLETKRMKQGKEAFREKLQRPWGENYIDKKNSLEE